MYNKYDKIVKTIIIEGIVCENHSYEYKIEIYKSHDGLYYSKFFRLNFFDLVPIITSELIYVKDNSIPQNVDEKGFYSVQESLDFALTNLVEFFHKKSTEQEEINKIYKYSEIVNIVLVEDITLSNKIKEQYKIEVYKSHEGLYFSRFFNLESFDLIVTNQGKLSSEDIYFKNDFLYITEEKGFPAAEDNLNFALSKLYEFYEGKKSLNQINQAE